jgi:hypothetical protein
MREVYLQNTEGPTDALRDEIVLVLPSFWLEKARSTASKVSSAHCVTVMTVTALMMDNTEPLIPSVY